MGRLQWWQYIETGRITLEATEMGRPLYEKYGFVKMEDEMVRQIVESEAKHDEDAE